MATARLGDGVLRWLLLVGAVWLVVGTALALVLGRMIHLHQLEPAPRPPDVPPSEATAPILVPLPVDAVVLVYGAQRNAALLAAGLTDLQVRDGIAPVRATALATLQQHATLTQCLLDSLLRAVPPQYVAQMDALAAERIDLTQLPESDAQPAPPATSW